MHHHPIYCTSQRHTHTVLCDRASCHKRARLRAETMDSERVLIFLHLNFREIIHNILPPLFCGTKHPARLRRPPRCELLRFGNKIIHSALLLSLKNEIKLWFPSSTSLLGWDSFLAHNNNLWGTISWLLQRAFYFAITHHSSISIICLWRNYTDRVLAFMTSLFATIFYSAFT